MSSRFSATALIFGVSIVFALAILGTSYLIKDHSVSEMVKFFLIAIWWIPFSVFCARAGRTRCCR